MKRRKDIDCAAAEAERLADLAFIDTLSARHAAEHAAMRPAPLPAPETTIPAHDWFGAVRFDFEKDWHKDLSGK